MDKLLSPFILCAMIIGVVLGEFAPKMREALDAAKFDSVSLRKCFPTLSRFALSTCLYKAIAIGLIVMMWPALTKIRYEKLPAIASTSRLWKQIGISVFLNWIIGPFVMLGLAWATLPDLPTYRTGVILIGIARCIAMVVIWTNLARGDNEYCAILVVVNALLQMILFSPVAVLFINVIGGHNQQELHVAYGSVAISVLIVCLLSF
jgi:ACR3 family arsenite transporter